MRNGREWVGLQIAILPENFPDLNTRLNNRLFLCEQWVYCFTGICSKFCRKLSEILSSFLNSFLYFKVKYYFSDIEFKVSLPEKILKIHQVYHRILDAIA